MRAKIVRLLVLAIVVVWFRAAAAPVSEGAITYDVYMQLASVQVIPYRVYELRWEIECTSDDRQPITKFPTAFSIDDSRLVFFDASTQQTQIRAIQDQQNFVYVREVPEMAVVCFRLYHRNELALEDCLVVDVRASDFADVRYSTKTRAHGNALTYQAQVTPSNGLYLLLNRNENNNETFLAGNLSTSSVSQHQHHRFGSACVAATALASIEAVFILFAAFIGLCLYFHKSGHFSLTRLSMVRRKRRTLGGISTTAGRLKVNGIKSKISNPQNQQRPQIIIKPVAVSNPPTITSEQHYRAPSATSADSGLSSTMSNGSSGGSSSIQARYQTKKQSPVVIYDDPPEFSSNRRTPTTTTTTPGTLKKSSVQEYLSEVWRRRPGSSPPPPPAPDYHGTIEEEPSHDDEGEAAQTISESLAYDIYAALEDPNNWDPPEQYWSSPSTTENGEPASRDDIETRKP